eukprot:11585033-Heterocapsa_arctica.AAC.1
MNLLQIAIVVCFALSPPLSRLPPCCFSLAGLWRGMPTGRSHAREVRAREAVAYLPEQTAFGQRTPHGVDPIRSLPLSIRCATGLFKRCMWSCTGF